MTCLVRTLFRWLVGLLLLWATILCFTTLIRLPLELNPRRVVLPLAAGFAAGLVFFTFVARLSFLYVAGHEITHWLTAKFFLRETGPVEVGARTGSVAVERPNIWIVLAPYFVPLYAVVWIGAYGVLQMLWAAAPGWTVTVFNVGLGVAYAFHVYMTIYALLRAQSDLQAHGAFLSLSLILFCNVALLLGCVVVATSQWSRGWSTLRAEWQRSTDWLVAVGAAGIDQARPWLRRWRD